MKKYKVVWTLLIKNIKKQELWFADRATAQAWVNKKNKNSSHVKYILEEEETP